MNEQEKALENLKSFIKIIKKIFTEDKINFDLLLGAGDSGIAMVRITELVLEQVGVNFPKKLVLPFYRFTEKHIPRGESFDNSKLIEEIKSTVSELKLNNILFVDDEINRARTLKGIIDLINRASPNTLSNDGNLYIVAENHGFSEDIINGLNIRFIPFGDKTKGMNNVILKAVPKYLMERLHEEYGKFYAAELICVLLNLPIKDLKDEKPYWSKALLDDVKLKVPDLENYQKEFENYLKIFIKENL